MWTLRYSADQFDNNLIEFRPWFCNVYPAPQKLNYSHSRLLVISCPLCALGIPYNLNHIQSLRYFQIIERLISSKCLLHFLRSDDEILSLKIPTTSPLELLAGLDLDHSIKVVNLESSYASSIFRFIGQLYWENWLNRLRFTFFISVVKLLLIFRGQLPVARTCNHAFQIWNTGAFYGNVLAFYLHKTN